MFSLFIHRQGRMEESHELTYAQANFMALNALYNDGTLISGVRVEIRDRIGIIYSANNP
jgi:hypothetical protein